MIDMICCFVHEIHAVVQKDTRVFLLGCILVYILAQILRSKLEIPNEYKKESVK